MHSHRNAKTVGGTVNNTVAVMVQSSQPSSRPFVGRVAHIRRIYTNAARAKPTAATIVGVADSSRTGTPHIVDDPFLVTVVEVKISLVQDRGLVKKNNLHNASSWLHPCSTHTERAVLSFTSVQRHSVSVRLQPDVGTSFWRHTSYRRAGAGDQQKKNQRAASRGICNGAGRAAQQRSGNSKTTYSTRRVQLLRDGQRRGLGSGICRPCSCGA